LCCLCVLGHKGRTANIIIIDEAALISRRMYTEVIAPLMRLDAVMVAISTNTGGSQSSHYTKLLDDAHMYQDIIIRQEISLMCESCKKAQKRPSECRCNDHLIPNWQIAERADVVKLLSFGNEMMYLREALGGIPGQSDAIFEDVWMEDLRTKLPRQIVDHENLVIFTMFDPNGGGPKSISDAALVSIVRNNHGIAQVQERQLASSSSSSSLRGMENDPFYDVPVVQDIIIVGLSAQPTKAIESSRPFLFSYFRRLHTVYPRAHHVLMIESNAGAAVQASTNAEIIMHAIPHDQITEYKTHPEYSGLWTHKTLKQAAADQVATALSFGEVSFSPDLVSFHANPKEAEYDKKELLTQLSLIRSDISAKDPKNGQKDDLAISFLLAVGHSNEFMYHPDYQHLAQRINKCNSVAILEPEDELLEDYNV